MNQGRLHASPAVRASVSSDGLVILDVDVGLVLASNPVGATIWCLVVDGRTTEQIARHIVESYDVPIDRAQRDVEAFLAALVARGVLIQELPC